MADTDDIIDSILNEEDNIEIDYNKTNYDINSILNENNDPLEMNEESKDPEKNIIKDQESLNEASKESSDNKSKEQQNKDDNNELLKKEKDEQLKKDLEKVLEEEEIKKKKKEEEEINNKKMIEAKKKMENFYPPFKNQLDFIQYFEVDNINGQISKEMQNFILQNQRKKDIKYEVSEIKSLSQINNELSKFDINAISAKTNNLIACSIDGSILFYSIKEQKLIKKIKPKNLQNSYINCLDVTDDFSDIICGYQDGTIAIINIITSDVRYNSNKVHKDSPVIELKIYKKDKTKDELYFISSDGEGQVFFHTYKMKAIKLFSTINSIPINVGNQTPVFLVKFITFASNQYANLKELKRYVIFGSQELISLYCVEPIKQIFVFKKPDYIKENVIPDAQVGIGRPPEVIMRFVKKDEKNHLILAIAWGKILYFYRLPIVGRNEINEYKELGYYINSVNILRIGFMNNSVIYCLDKSFAIKVLDSSKINQGKVNIKDDQPVIPKNNSLAEIEKSRLVSANISSQMKLNDAKGNKRETYLYSIVDNIDLISSVVVLSEKQIYNVKLVNWEIFLNNLQNKEDFINLFSIGIDLYTGKMMALSGIPKKTKNRNDNDLIKYLKNIVSQYVILNTGEKKTGGFFLEETEDKEKISNCIKIAIEFCIEIEEVEFLLKVIEPLFEAKEYGELFLAKLQPFILCDKIINIILSSNIILNLIDLYNKNDKLDILSQMLLHINIKSIDTIEIKEKLEEMYLFPALIYLYMNGQQEDYFAPLDKMFDFFSTRAISASKFIYNEEENCIDYSNALTKQLINQKEIRNCKEYNGHKILWYIRWCLTGKKFPDNTKKMEKTLFDAFVPKITYWLLNPKVIQEFLKFDPKNYFMIHKNIFSIVPLRNKLEEAAKDSKNTIEVKSSLSFGEIKIDDIEPKSLVNYLVMWCKKKNDIQIYFYLYDFIISALNSELELEKEMKIESICYTLKYYKQIVKHINNQEVKTLNDVLIKLIDKDKTFNKDNYKTVLDSINGAIFNELKLYLFDKIDNFGQCLKLYLDKDFNLPEKSTKLYNWINDKLMVYNGTSNYEKFIDIIKENTLPLASISINKFYELSKEIFQGSNKTVILKLKSDKNIQLNYIELIIKYIINTYENNEYNVSNEEMKDIKFILDLHIQLLCDLHYHDKIIPAIKTCTFYPLADCIKSCEKAKVYEPLLFLYLKEGNIDKAFKMALEELNKAFDKTIEISKKNNKSELEKQLDVYNKYLTDVKNICEKNESINAPSTDIKEQSIGNPKSEGPKIDKSHEELWFTILGKLYDYEMKAEEINSKVLSQIIIKDIKELMDKMCSFVGINRVLEIFTERNKNAGFKEFRDLLIEILDSNGKLENIYFSARSLLTNLVLENENYFLHLNSKGEYLDSPTCAKCKQKIIRNINKNENIYIFNCTHTFHKACINKGGEKEVVCPLCTELEFSNSDFKGKSLIQSSNSILDDKENSRNANKFQVNMDAGKRNTIRKFERFDNKNLEKHKLMIDNSISVLIDQYRMEYKEKNH
jgi:hypothetical protein